MPIYMNYSGISGEAQSRASHQQWIEISSFQWGVGRGISSPTGGSSDREGSSPSVSEIVVTKPTDAASPNFFQHCLGGKKFKVSIGFTNVVGGGPPVPRHTLDLTDAVITDIKPYFPQRSGRGELTRHEKLTSKFSEYYFNGLRNVLVPRNIGSF